MGIKIKQHDMRDCGATCLASIAAHYRLKLPIAKIRQFASTDLRGTNVLGIIQAAEKMNFKAKGVKGGLDALPNLPLPVIAHAIIGEQQLHHYVVIYKIITPKNKKKGKVTVMDPGVGKMKHYTFEEFKEIWTGVLILFEPNQEFSIGNEKTSVYRRFWQLVRPHRLVVFQALFGALIYTLLGLTTSIYVQKITDFVLVDGNRNLLNLMSVIMIILLLLQIYINSTKSIMILRTGQMIDANLILGYYKHLLDLPQRFFDTMRTGEIISRINDAVKIRAFINDVAINLVVNVLIVVFSFALMFTYYWKLALIILLVIPLYALIYAAVNYFNKRVERRLMENAADLESQFVESINSVRTIKQFGVEEQTNAKTEQKFGKLLDTIYTSGKNVIFSSNSGDFLSRVFTIVLLWVGAGYVINRQITPGELLSFYALIGYFNNPINQLIGMNKTIQNALIAADRLFEIMDLEREESTEKIPLTKELIGNIHFQEVSFSYGTRKEVFQDFTIEFQKGELSAIVGESGSGKTTIAALIQNLYPIKSGKISIGDYGLNYINRKSLRHLIGVVPQQLDLFAGNIIENIALGHQQPDVKRILDLTKELGILSFIEQLPFGFETQLGENGLALSGGQRQRIAIARALYKNPEIILLDEATSALDSESEESVQNVLERLRGEGKTLIVIAHRLSTIKNADEIFVLKNGKLIEQGNHQSLLEHQGAYHKMWEKQGFYFG